MKLHPPAQLSLRLYTSASTPPPDCGGFMGIAASLAPSASAPSKVSVTIDKKDRHV